MTTRTLVALTIFMLAGACERPQEDAQGPEEPAPEPAAPEIAEEDESEEDSPMLDLEQTAQAADRALRQRLLGRVMEVVESDGLPAAVTVCHEEAIPLTTQVGEEFDVSIGRVSDRLRNPDNIPPAWAAEMIESADEEAQTQDVDDVHRRVSPLHIGAPCLNCHGAREDIAPDVLTVIDELYPDDRATGYAESQLRGWVWVEAR